MEALNPEIKSEQVQQPELLEPNGSGAALPPLLLLLLNVKTQLSRPLGSVWIRMLCVKLNMGFLANLDGDGVLLCDCVIFGRCCCSSSQGAESLCSSARKIVGSHLKVPYCSPRCSFTVSQEPKMKCGKIQTGLIDQSRWNLLCNGLKHGEKPSHDQNNPQHKEWMKFESNCTLNFKETAFFNIFI